MEKLMRGIHEFQSNIFREREELFHRLSKGQNPEALFITCSDSRIVPDLITQTDPGDLFVIRNAGNLVPSYGAAVGGEAATIEYAIRGLGVRDIIVCGHTRCGAMQAALEPERLAEMPRVKQWLTHAESSREIVNMRYSHLSPDAKWKVMTQENVLVQLEHLRTHPAVAVALSSGDVRLHAWVYKIETGEVFAYDYDSGQYLPLLTPEGTRTVSPLVRDRAVRAQWEDPAVV